MSSAVPYLGNDDLFFQNLNGIQVVGCFLLTKDNFTKGALPEDFQEFKIIQWLKRYIADLSVMGFVF